MKRKRKGPEKLKHVDFGCVIKRVCVAWDETCMVHCIVTA